MSNVVKTRFGDRGLVHLRPVELGGSPAPAVNTIENRPWDPRQPQGPAPPQNWYNGPSALGQLPQVYGPGNFVPPPGQLSQVMQQANVPSMQSYNYGQYPTIGGAHPAYQQYGQQPQMGMQQQPQMGMQPQSGPPPWQVPLYQPPQGQEKHIFYGPDGKVLPGPPPGFAVEGSIPRDPVDYPQDFAIEGILDYGRLRSVQLLHNTKRFPKIPDYLHTELLMKYKHYDRTYVKIVSRGGEIHVHANPFVDDPPPRQYEYVPVYVDENENVIGDRYRTAVDEPYGYYDRGWGYRPQYPYTPEIGLRPDLREPLPPIRRYQLGSAPRTIVNGRGVDRIERPSTDY